MIDLAPALAPADIDTARTLFREYEAELGIDLCFQGFEQELASLPGDYAPPAGRLLFARVDGAVAGCVALRPLEPEVCEMKRLYTRPAFRGQRIGLRLVYGVVFEAKAIGYRRMRLDTLPVMTTAIALYRSLGFRPIDPYRPNPIAGALYLELEL
jgi:ribosomal protein S18 acetylase RimI-like enzyme